MQLQQEREPDTRQKPPRSRRSVGELLAAWLLVLWGAAITIIAIGSQFLDGPAPQVSDACLRLQGIFCFAGGFFSLLRHRIIAQWLLALASLCITALAILLVWGDMNHPGMTPTNKLIILGVGAGLLILAASLFLLGRWLGRQEDSEA